MQRFDLRPAAGSEILDLGRIDGPMLIFGGTYSNLEATEALLAAAARHGIAPANMICTGDVVAYCADAAAVTALIRDAGIATVMGNCEESLGAEAADCGCGFAPGTTCERLSAAWFSYASAVLTDDDKRWMAGLPRRIAFTLAGRRMVAVHGAPSLINRFIFRSTPAAVKRGEIDLVAADAVLGGHCGLPFSELIDGRLWHNSGAIGMPANDGTPRVWYSILTPGPGGIRIDHHGLTYNHAAAAAKMRAAGLPREYEQALASGLWDNDDILPPAETAAKGTGLAFAPLLWSGTAGHDAAPPPRQLASRRPA